MDGHSMWAEEPKTIPYLISDPPQSVAKRLKTLGKPKASTKGNDDLDEYDFGEDEDDDEDEPAPEVDDDTGEVEARPLDDYLLDEDEPKKEDE